MYYLRMEAHTKTFPKIKRTDGTIIPERTYTVEDRAIYKHHDFNRYYRGPFKGLDSRYDGMKVYQCKTLKHILHLREWLHGACGELFDVYDENGKVDI